MNRILNSIKKLTAVIIFTMLIVSCGGGGGDASVTETPNTATDTTSKVELKKDYTPDSAKLAIMAQSSIDLYVEPNFNFNSHQKVIFNINVTNSEGEPMTNKVLSISSIYHEVEAYDDPRLQEKALLAMTKTDNDGQVYLTLEIPQSISNILLELNAVGIENEVIRLIDDSGVVMYHFQPN
ncbi:MAG: hypothetical protein JKX76_13045 [Colwellia sp.]|nr:hypothetical protein [Colwellia sp.]